MFTRVENGMTKCSPKKQKTPKKWIRNVSSFQWLNGREFLFFWPRKNNFFLGGGGV